MGSGFNRRSSNDGESTARDHPLYKNALPQADGLFHCPWEGRDNCNHKPEKLKCNYEYVKILSALSPKVSNIVKQICRLPPEALPLQG
jgi:hypothetical protein